MAQRRSLIEGVTQSQPVDQEVAREFVFGSKDKSSEEGATKSVVASTAPATSRSPISTRIRTDFASALKRASLERQLSGIEPNTLQDILEEAIVPWLKANGYLDSTA